MSHARNHPRIFPWLRPPAPAPAFEATALVRPGPRFGAFIGHSHVRQPQPDPGAPAYAYEGLGLVEFTPIGAATVNRDHLYPLPQTPTLFAAQAAPLQGLGGLVTGQFVTQPLLYDPSLQSEELYGAPAG